MLSPAIQDSRQKLTDAYAGVLALDGLSQSCQSIQIVPIDDEPAWLPAVSGEIAELDAAANAWQRGRADVWAPIILSFQNYFAVFSGVANADLSIQKDADFWIEILTQTLLPAANKALAATQAAERAIQVRQRAFSVVLPHMDQSIAAGWSALASEEQDMLALTEQLGELTQSLDALQDKLTSDAIASDKGITQSAVSLLYAAGAAGAEASVPILGVVVAVITIGKSFYDLVEDNDEIAATMKRIDAVQKRLSDEALGVALTKSTLQTLYSVEEQYLEVRDAIPGLVDLWTTQQTKVQDTVNALRAGAKPSLCLDLATLPQALTAWQDVIAFVNRIAQIDSTAGEPVTLDIATATVRPTLATR